MAARQQKPVETTGELTEIIRRAIPMKIQAAGGHPAKRTFQAVRIELNRELDVLRESLDGMIDMLGDGGRILSLIHIYLMVSAPERYIQDFADCGADSITVHAEACEDLERAIELIHDAGVKAGVSIKPATPVNDISHLLSDVDLSLIHI